MSQTEDSLKTQFPLKKVKIIKRTLLGYLGFFFIGLFGAVVSLSINILITMIILLVMAGVFAGYLYYNLLYYRNYAYDLTPDGLLIGKGVISSWKITVPSHKIQDVYLDQDILDRIFGIYDLHLSTATAASEREAHIDGIGLEDAKILRQKLLAWMGEYESSPEKIKTYKPGKAGFYVSVFGSLMATAYILLVFFDSYGLALMILVGPIVAVINYLEYYARKYSIGRDGVLVKTGYFIPKESIFLYRNIQDVEAQQGFQNRIFGIHTLVIKTMTDSSAVNARMTYLNKEDAVNLRNEIMEMSRKSPQQQKTMGIDSSEQKTMDVVSHVKIDSPPMKPLSNPYPLHIIKSAGYSIAAVFSLSLLAVIFIIPFIVAGVTKMAVFGILFPLAVAAVVSGVILVNALILFYSYSYDLERESVNIQINFMSKTKRQILYSKIQDIVNHVSFLNSFAKLTDIKLETGSKEFIGQGNNQTIQSGSMANETIPALTYEDAEKIKEKVAQQMGINLQGLQKTPLHIKIPLDPKKPLKKTLKYTLNLSILYIIVAAALLYIQMTWLIIALTGLTLPIIIMKYLYEREYLKRYSYDYNQDVLQIKKGVFGSREITIPFSKIQDIYINQDVIDAAVGLYDVYVSTATARSLLNAHIDGLNQKNAQAIAYILAEKIKQNLN